MHARILRKISVSGPHVKKVSTAEKCPRFLRLRLDPSSPSHPLCGNYVASCQNGIRSKLVAALDQSPKQPKHASFGILVAFASSLSGQLRLLYFCDAKLLQSGRPCRLHSLVSSNRSTNSPTAIRANNMFEHNSTLYLKGYLLSLRS